MDRPSLEPVTGCTKVSQGCKNCYAERIYERFNGKDTFKNVICHKDRLAAPLHWRKPARIFVNSMSDLFHKDVPFQFVVECFHIMSLCCSHTFQILTKRPQRMLEFFTDCAYNPYGSPFKILKNVWLGVSCEDQKTADERIPLLLKTPAAVRFLSCEPLLAQINLSVIPFETPLGIMLYSALAEGNLFTNKINWVIVGGESGSHARPMHPDWVRNIRNQCAHEKTPFFFKQWGEWDPLEGIRIASKPNEIVMTASGEEKILTTDTRAIVFRRAGKTKTGRWLDGNKYSEFPEVKN